MSEGSVPLSKKKREEPFVDAPTAGAQRRTPLMAAASTASSAPSSSCSGGARATSQGHDGETALVYAQRGVARRRWAAGGPEARRGGAPN